ncbi:hypothetical protein ACFGVS_20180 [Mucilaginibacter sp. AW1-7]|uniref:hypothetical protein n=1 Tax=Mucilaginibacter sp. AW1-7 TaxID=3349874 RepID=UPI003F73599A
MPDINEKLTILYDVLVDNSETFEREIIELISQAALISSPTKFASLLVSLKNPRLIEPLLLQISKGEKGDVWLCDFLYAASRLLDEVSEEDEVATPKILVAKLGDWVVNSTGELAWMAAGLLKFSPGKSAKEIQLQKLEQRGDFFLTYVECVLGLLRNHKGKYLPMVQQMATDETRDIKLREYCQKVINERNDGED